MKPNTSTTSHWEARGMRVGLGNWDPAQPWGVYVDAVLNAEDRNFTSIRNTPAIPAPDTFRADPREVSRMVYGMPGNVAWAYRILARWALGETVNPAGRACVENGLGVSIDWKSRNRMKTYQEIAP